jgi:hypothetical protein
MILSFEKKVKSPFLEGVFTFPDKKELRHPQAISLIERPKLEDCFLPQNDNLFKVLH